MRIILASGSPRRMEILARLGVDFEVVVSEADENTDIKDPAALVRELSLRKGKSVLERLTGAGENTRDRLIISSDTVVFCGGEILGKPSDRADAQRMLRMLSGRGHWVYTGVAAIYGGREVADTARAEVVFRELGEDEIKAYIDTGEYADKAGAYAVQGRAARFVREVRGDYLTVVGLPAKTLSDLLLREFDIRLPVRQQN
ncbi:MAG TPA: septum formation protein Maf [Clostridiales bacterium]|jgi:septum formation protein|nr:septum formation protein Maf [Clostridiales bacterium]